jgi:hypothetical protein
MGSEHTAAGDGGATRRNVLKGATAAVFAPTPTRAPAQVRTRTPQPQDNADVEWSVASARAIVEQALASPTLPGIPLATPTRDRAYSADQ